MDFPFFLYYSMTLRQCIHFTPPKLNVFFYLRACLRKIKWMGNIQQDHSPASSARPCLHHKGGLHGRGKEHFGDGNLGRGHILANHVRRGKIMGWRCRWWKWPQLSSQLPWRRAHPRRCLQKKPLHLRVNPSGAGYKGNHRGRACQAIPIHA